ncbi:hypothetical protein ACTFIW_004843 [Dictyostelium discoideum]
MAWGEDSGETYYYPSGNGVYPPGSKKCHNDCNYQPYRCYDGICSCPYGYNLNPYDCSDKCSYAGCTKFIDSISDATLKGGPITLLGWFDNDYSSIFITVDGVSCPIYSNSSTSVTCLAPRISGSVNSYLYIVETTFTDSNNNTMMEISKTVSYNATNCFNQCSGVGSCDENGNCNCLSGYSGEDCSIIPSSPSSSSSSSSIDEGGFTIEITPFTLILLFIFILITIITSKK